MVGKEYFCFIQSEKAVEVKITEQFRLEGSFEDCLDHTLPTLKAGSACCSGLCPVGFLISLKMEAPQFPWETYSRV